MPKAASLFKNKADDTPAAPVVGAKKQASRNGQHLISALFDEPVYRQFTVLAAEEGKERRELVREALNLLFQRYNKPPIA